MPIQPTTAMTLGSMPVLAMKLNTMWAPAASRKPASGARMRTTLLAERRAMMSPMPARTVNNGWPNAVLSPRSITISASAASGSPVSIVVEEYTMTRL